VADGPTTLFTIDAAGVSKRVSVYALGIGRGEDPEAYRAFETLAELLSTFEQQVARGQVLTAETYQPELYRATLMESGPDFDAMYWPWSDLAPDDFQFDPHNPSRRIAGMTPDQVAMVTAVPSGGVIGVPLQAPDGAFFDLALRPLLPGEPVVDDAPR
jgi:hypothetical protein